MSLLLCFISGFSFVFVSLFNNIISPLQFRLKHQQWEAKHIFDFYYDVLGVRGRGWCSGVTCVIRQVCEFTCIIREQTYYHSVSLHFFSDSFFAFIVTKYFTFPLVLNPHVLSASRVVFSTLMSYQPAELIFGSFFVSLSSPFLHCSNNWIGPKLYSTRFHADILQVCKRVL